MQNNSKNNFSKSVLGKSRGFGDSIARFTQVTGINTLAQIGAKAIGKKDCGCKKRQEALNKKFPYKK